MAGASPTSAPPQSSPPDWNTVTLELYCPRCGYNLRTLTGSRCPECGLDLDWERITASAQNRINSPLFEYHWRTRPVQSYITTLGRSFRPARLWRELALADDPRSAGLTLFALVTCTLFFSLTALGSYLTKLSYLLRYYRGGTRWRKSDIIDALMGSAHQLSFIATNVFTVWLALQVFQQTFARGRIRQSHLFRLVILATSPVLLIKAVTNLALNAAHANFGYYENRNTILAILFVSECSAILVFILSMAWWFSSYLKANHGTWTAISILFLVFLFWVAVLFSYAVSVRAWHNAISSWANSAWPGIGNALFHLLSI